MDLLDYNITSNEDVIRLNGGACTAVSLVWGSDDVNKINKPDLILLADCIYYEEVGLLNALHLCVFLLRFSSNLLLPISISTSLSVL